MKCGAASAVGVVALTLGSVRNWPIIFSALVPDATWINYAPKSEVDCPLIDRKSFKEKLLKVPEVRVDSHFDCVRHGRAINRPILCTGFDVYPEFAEDMVADPTVYNLACYNLSAPPPFRGLGSTVAQTRTRPFNGTLRDVMEERDCYAGFIVGDNHQQILKKAFPHLDEHDPFQDPNGASGVRHFGTSFMSNFEQNEISAADHAALIESMVYQLSGRKMFLLHDRQDSTHPYLMTGHFLPYPSCAKDYWSTLDHAYVAVVKPGSYLYFPFSWQHTVWSEAGLNVMTNIRITSMNHIFKHLTMKELMAFGLRTLFKGRPRGQSNPRTWDVKKEFLFQFTDMLSDQPSTDVIKSVLEEFL